MPECVQELQAIDQVEVREDRFQALIERHSRFVFRVAYAVLRNSHDAEDAVQEMFLKLYRSGAWQTMEDEKAFLARAVWRMAVGKRSKRTTEPVDTEMAGWERNPEESAIASDWSAAIFRLIDALPEDLRRPLALSGIEGLNSREIAQLMGIAEGTVRTRLMRARQLMKRKLETRMGGKT